MGKLSKAPTEKDIDELIELARSRGHEQGANYLELLKKELDFTQDSTPTGKKMLRSNFRENAIELLQASDEAVGAETPTQTQEGYRAGILALAQKQGVRIEDQDWKASAMREEV